MVHNLPRGAVRTAFVLAIFDCAMAARADVALIERVRKEAPPAWEDLAKLFLHVNVELHVISEVAKPRPGTKVQGPFSLTYAFSGGKIRWHQFKKLADGTNIEGAGVRRDDEYAFEAERRGDSAPFVLTDVHVPNPRRRPAGEIVPQLLKSPWKMLHMDLRQWFDSPRFSITNASEIPEVEVGAGNKQRAVRVEFTYDHRGEKNARVAGGWFDLLPDQYWALLRCRAINPSGAIKIARITYGPPTPPFPPLVSSVYEVYHPDGTTLFTRQTVEFDRFEFGDAPDEDFTFAALGLPEVAVGGGGWRRQLWFWLLNIGMVLVALALFIRFRVGGRAAKENENL